MIPRASGQPPAPDRPYRGVYLVGLVIFGVVTVRAALDFQGQDQLIVLFLLTAFGALYLAEPRLTARHRWFRWLYFPTQVGLLVAAGCVQPFLDMIATLCLPLAPQAIHSFSRRVAAAWIAVLIVAITAPLVLDGGWAPGLVLALTNVAGGVFMLTYDQLYLQVRAGQLESLALLAELQQAHDELRAYMTRAEELAAARERNRLTRELHDSVSQIMFSVTLTAQATRRLLDLDRARAAEQIDRLQEMAAGALAELRSLIAQLHPQPGSSSVASPTTADHRPPSTA